jgi:hypothetical protein
MSVVLLSQAWTSVLVGVVTAIVAAVAVVVATPLQYVFSRRALEHKLQSEYEYEQRKELRQLIGRYHGRLVEAADAWRNRMNNLYDHQASGHMAVHGSFTEPDYYFGTSVYRFMTLAALARRFEAEAFYLDARIADRADLDILKYAKAFRWIMTDLALVQSLEYDAWGAPDHFLNDRYRGLCDAFAPGDGLPSLAEFEARSGHEPQLEPVLCFFDGLQADEDRLRWDRLVAHHLLVSGFLNLAGYDMQHSDDEYLAKVVGQFRQPRIAANLVAAIDKLGLGGEANAARIQSALRARPEVGALLAASEPASVAKEPLPADV